MSMITHAHIALLKDIDRRVQEVEDYSATKQKQIMELYTHGLVSIENDEVRIKEKAKAMILDIEAYAHKWITDNVKF